MIGFRLALLPPLSSTMVTGADWDWTGIIRINKDPVREGVTGRAYEASIDTRTP